jgi:flavin reductase (DIM6/NTAB) family NADH-FMN oxidoreductase RutF
MPVAVIGAGDGIDRSCATGTLMYVSLVPPQVAIALHPGSRTCALIRATGEFSASILSTDQLGVAMKAGRSGRGQDKFTANGIPMLDPPVDFASPGVAESIAVLWCRVAREVETGDHVLVIGTVVHHVTLDETGRQLLRVARRYAALGASLSEEAPEGYPL